MKWITDGRYGITLEDLDIFLTKNPLFSRYREEMWDKMQGEEMCVQDALQEALKDLFYDPVHCPSDNDNHGAYADTDDWMNNDC